MQQETAGDTPTVDISDELVYLRECQQAFALSQEVLQQIVINAQGNLSLSISMMQSSCQILHASCAEHLRAVWADGKGRLSPLQEIAPNSIASFSGQRVVVEDNAVPRLQTASRL